MAKKSEIVKVEPSAPLTVPTASNRELTPAIWRMIGEMAPVMYKSRLFGVMSQEQAAAIMLKGYELGLSMTASFEFVQVIQGKPALSPRGAMALLLSNPLVADVKITRIEDGKKFIGYECRMERSTGFSFVGRFTLDDATRAGLMKPDSGWAKYPENMCLWRAVGFAADVVFPDVTAGMTTLMKAPEMYGVALTEGGDVIEAKAQPIENFQEQLDAMLVEYGAEKLMQACNGIPTTLEQLHDAREKLK